MNTSKSAVMLTAMLALTSMPAAAQTDYYNTDAGRPVTIEDAFPVERYAFELQAAPFRLERQRGGVYQWGVEPELAYGIFPRTQLEIGFPLVYVDNELGERSFGLAGIDASVLHNLNVETETLPAFALAADVVLPAGHFAPGSAVFSGKALLTRTFNFARIHANGRYTFGSDDAKGVEAVSRWQAGLAVDRTFPLRSMLVIGEFFVAQPITEDSDLEWNAGAGIRYQQGPRFAIDAGIGKALTGHEQSWHFTIGAAYAFAVRALMPGQ
jgi:hypothetical protein